MVIVSLMMEKIFCLLENEFADWYPNNTGKKLTLFNQCFIVSHRNTSYIYV